MKTTILKQSLILLSSATLLAACGGDGGDSPVDDFGSNPGESGAQGLLYAYPDNGQGEVPTKAPIALRFTSNVAPGNVNQSVTLCCDDQGENLDFEVERVDGEPRGVLLTPTDGLAPGTEYTVEINGLRLSKGTAKDQTLTFTTRTLQEGPKSAVVQEVPAGEDAFQLSRTMPNGSELEPVMDFSAFRFQFTQPIDRATATYGDGNSVVLRDSEGAVVEAGLLVDGAYMTVDPTDDYLTPGETYTLTLGGLESTYGETFAGETLEFTPKDSSPRGEPGFLVQRITQDGTSRLTGKGINQVPVNGTLLGEDVNVTQAQSDLVIAELADVTQYTDVTPIRLPKGTLLEGTPIEMVKIGGEVDAGFGSGDVTMRVLSDATGYLVPNSYTENHPDKLRIVHLFMDVGIATANPKANGGFTQNLLHIHLVGVAEVDPNGGVLNIDATSMVEPDILGQEYGYGLLSFQLQSYKNQTDGLLAHARAMLEDTTPPTLQSWTLGTDGGSDQDKVQLHAPGESITLNFDEPLDPESVEGHVRLFQNGNSVEIDHYSDGSALVIKPAAMKETNQYGTTVRHPESLEYSSENDPVIYTLEIGGDVVDFSGNGIIPITEQIEMPIKVENKTVLESNDDRIDSIPDHAPIVLSAYPGFPCALSEEGRDLTNDLAGRCEGGYPMNTDENDLFVRQEDDSIPVMGLPGNRPIIVHFSKAMDQDSIILGTTFTVERINEEGLVQSEIPGELEIHPRKLIFRPDQPWENGELYKYSILSSGYEIGNRSGVPDLQSVDNYACGMDSVCDKEDGMPLQTIAIGLSTAMPADEVGNGSPESTVVYMSAADFDAGGPPMEQFFRGAEPNNNIVQILSTKPVSDVNHSFYHEADTPENVTDTHPLLGQLGTLGHYEYETEEYGPTSIPDTQYPEYDPNGVRPGKNSAKVLSMFEREGEPIPFPYVSGANIGCSYNFEEKKTTGCADRMFTYLMSALVAEVTDEVSKEGYIKVLLWPSQVAGTSLPFFAIQYAPLEDLGLPPGMGLPDPFGVPNPRETGPQFLRMRFQKGDDTVNGRAVRNKPIEAFIKQEGDTPILEATVDLYLNAPEASELGYGGVRNATNMTSYPLEMTLTGPVHFLDDGRMTVEQFNVNRVDIPLEVGACTEGGCNADGLGYSDLFIPEYGSRLNFISEPIK